MNSTQTTLLALVFALIYTCWKLIMHSKDHPDDYNPVAYTGDYIKQSVDGWKSLFSYLRNRKAEGGKSSADRLSEISHLPDENDHPDVVLSDPASADSSSQQTIADSLPEKEDHQT